MPADVLHSASKVQQSSLPSWMFLTASRQSAGDISRCAAQKRKQLLAAIEVVLPDLLLLALISGYEFLLFDYAKRFERHIDRKILFECA